MATQKGLEVSTGTDCLRHTEIATQMGQAVSIDTEPVTHSLYILKSLRHI